MADPNKLGTTWRDDELDVIVADYFEMLGRELRREPYKKSHHAKRVMERIGRTHKAVEFKHQNISAVLDELGLPWIPGYIPKRNYQNAIFGAIERYLAAHRQILEHVPEQPRIEAFRPDALFVVPPPARLIKPIPALDRLVRRFDPVERDYRNRQLGRAGEEFVLDVERRRLDEGGRRDLASRVRWISDQDGDGAGFDILSFDPAGAERWIEVKTTNGSARTPFFLSRNEWAVAEAQPEQWRIFRVHEFSTSPRIFTVAPPLEHHLHLAPETWRASPR